MREPRPWLVLLLAVLVASALAGQNSEAAPANELAPDRVDLRLQVAAGTMNHRLLLYEICATRGCSRKGYLQWFKTEWDPELDTENQMPRRVILETCLLTELTGEAKILKAYWLTGSGADPELVVEVALPTRSPTTEEFRFTPRRPCDYEFSRGAPAE